MSSKKRKINWATPSPEDLLYVKSLTKEERHNLLVSACDESLKSGTSDKSLEEIWQEAVRLANQAA